MSVGSFFYAFAYVILSPVSQLNRAVLLKSVNFEGQNILKSVDFACLNLLKSVNL